MDAWLKARERLPSFFIVSFHLGLDELEAKSAEGGRLFTQSTESNASLSQKQCVTSYLSVPAQLGGHRKLTATISDFYMDTNGGRVSQPSSPLGVANGMSARARGVGDGACHLHTLALEGRVLPTPHGEKP